MEIISKNIADLIPYENNPRRNDRAVAALAESIKAYGFKVPCVIDKNGVLITGHTRYKAAKKLGYTEIPCIIADDLTEEQIAEFRIADNKVGEISQWDKGKLAIEIAKMPKFEPLKVGFKSTDLSLLKKVDSLHAANAETTQNRCANILNLEIAEFVGEGDWDIPLIFATSEKEIPKISEWVGFNFVLNDKSSDKEKKHKGVHFFIDDYQFERVWTRPEIYVDILKKYGCVLSPDFSPYEDMPLATQLWNHYRKHWTAAYWQQNGIKVIPTIRKSANPRAGEWWLDGEPKGGVVAISTMWNSNPKIKAAAIEEYESVLKVLRPTKILIYGKKEAYIKFKNVEVIETFSSKKWSGQDR